MAYYLEKLKIFMFFCILFFNWSLQAKSLELSEYKGSVVYLDFWASWCEPCKDSFPWMNSIQKKYQTKGLRVVAVNLDKDPKLAGKFIKKMSPIFEIVFDPEAKIAEKYAVEGMPYSVILDRNGKILKRHIGFDKKSSKVLEKIILKSL